MCRETYLVLCRISAYLQIRQFALDLSIHFLMSHNMKQKDEQTLNWLVRDIRILWVRDMVEEVKSGLDSLVL